ncbi:HNH nuclease [Candidatus Nanopelagicaceae bacterium]
MTNRNFVDAIEVNVADSFVSRENKLGTGNGETRLYVGGRSIRSGFFGDFGFKVSARLRKSELVRFLEEMKDEYMNPSLEYRDKKRLPKIWEERMKSLLALPNEEIDFYVYDTQLRSQTSDEHRIYIDSDDSAYHYLHDLPLSGSARLAIVKYQELTKSVFEFKLIPDFEGYSRPPAAIQIERELNNVLQDLEIKNSASTSIERLVTARIGQMDFRKKLLHGPGAKCAFTGIAEPSLLIAGHIKPWSVSNNSERLSPQNGLLFTPTYDRLFNNGYISFHDDRKLLISPLLSKLNASILGLENGMEVEIPILGAGNRERRGYMKYHRENVYRA